MEDTALRLSQKPSLQTVSDSQNKHDCDLVANVMAVS